MIRRAHIESLCGLALAALLAWAAVVALSSCQAEAARGTAQSASAGAASRASTTASAADDAGVRAVALRAEADATGSATVSVQASIAEAVAAELRAQAGQAREDAADAERRAEAEACRQRAAADRQSWITWCRWIGLGGVVAGVALGSLLAWAISPRIGVAGGGCLALAGLAALGLAEVAPWILAAVPAAGLLVAAWWAWRHRRDQAQGAADWSLARSLSAALDAAEADPQPDLAMRQDESKQALADALEHAGRKPALEALRGPLRDWPGRLP
jgi:hypothetical protein